jgi:hypothetical protein
MESKTLCNLSSSYKNFLKKLNEEEEFNKINEDSNLLSVNKLYDTINTLLKDDCLQIADINHMMINYEKNNNIIDKIKKISSLRNYLIVTMAIKSSKWPLFIDKLKAEYKIDKKIAEKKMLNLFQKYIGTWNTIDKFFIMNENGTKIKKITIIDPDDIEFILTK